MNKYQNTQLVDSCLYPLCFNIAPIFHKLNITPNVVTTISVLLGSLSIYCQFQAWFWLSGLSLLGYYFFDCLDGAIARRYKQTSEFGAAYDYTKDVLFFFLLFLVFNSFCLMILGCNLLIWQGNMERGQKKHGPFYVYNKLIDAYDFIANKIQINNLNFFYLMGTGEFIFILFLSIVFNSELPTILYSLFVIISYVVGIANKNITIIFKKQS